MGEVGAGAGVRFVGAGRGLDGVWGVGGGRTGSGCLGGGDGAADGDGGTVVSFPAAGFFLKSERSRVPLLPTNGAATLFAELPGRFNGSNTGGAGDREGAILFLPVARAAGEGVPSSGAASRIVRHLLSVRSNTVGVEAEVRRAASCETRETPCLRMGSVTHSVETNRTHRSQASNALIPGNADRCSGLNSDVAPGRAVVARRWRRMRTAVWGMCGSAEALKNGATSVAGFMAVGGRRENKGIRRKSVNVIICASRRGKVARQPHKGIECSGRWRLVIPC